jgi:hypothetical protein
MPASNTVLNPAGWPQPKGYANGIKARGETVLAGMIGWDVNGVLPKARRADQADWKTSSRC